MKSSETKYGSQETTVKPVDWNSIILLIMLTLPAGIMAVVLLAWPNVRWVAEIPYTVIGTLGSFVALLLSVFIIARYHEKPGVLYISAGLMAMAIINGLQSVLHPEASEFVWLHSIAGIFGGLFFVLYILSRIADFPVPSMRTTAKTTRRLLSSVAVVASVAGILVIVFSNSLPTMVQEGQFSNIAWMINIVPIGLFLFAGISLFQQYRQAGTRELFLFTAVVIFLFQVSEVFYFAPLWSIIWWFWLALRLIVYLTVMIFLLREYIQTGNHLTAEIEERKKVEIALRKAYADWLNSFNSLDDVMMIIDKDYRIENINSSGLALLEDNKEELLGRKCYEVFHNMDNPPVYCPVQKTFETGEVASVERYDESFDRHFSMKSLPITNGDSTVTKAVYLIRDISKQIEAEEKEKLLQRELNLTSRLASIGEVAAGITHEINNPLTSVIAFAQILAQQDVPENIKEAVEVINDGADRIAGIVDKLLAFARRHKPEKEYVDVNAIINSVIGMRSYEMRNNNVSVKTYLAPDLVRTMVNDGELQQVFLNIILNAEQAIADARLREGKISVRTEMIEGYIRITLSNNGPEIPEQHIDKLFDPFFTTKDSEGGTGLGLSISYGIIQEHGGKIQVRNLPDKGVSFTIDLPVIAEVDHKTEPTISPKDEQEILTGLKILVVDDEKHICLALKRVLSDAGHKVETVNVARTALQRLNRVKFDVILLDIKMPGMDGIDFYNRIKAIDSSLQDRVICITGDVISRRNKAFLDKTDIPCITKPFTIDELMRQIKLVIGGQVEDEQVTYSYS